MTSRLRLVALEFLETAPMRVVLEAGVDASPAAVFAAITADPSAWTWFPVRVHGQVTGAGAPGVGASREFSMLGARVVETVLACEPPARWAYRGDSSSLPLFRALIEVWAIEGHDGHRPVDAGRRPARPVAVLAALAAPGLPAGDNQARPGVCLRIANGMTRGNIGVHVLVERAVRKGQQPPWMVPDGLWERIGPLLPVIPRRADHPGRRRLDDRKVLSGILFVLYTGIPWEFLPQELGFGSGMTCWRRLRDWHQAGVWQQLHELLLAELNAAGALDWSKAVIDSSHVRAVKGGPKPGRARSTAPSRAPSTT